MVKSDSHEPANGLSRLYPDRGTWPAVRFLFAKAIHLIQIGFIRLSLSRPARRERGPLLQKTESTWTVWAVLSLDYTKPPMSASHENTPMTFRKASGGPHKTGRR